MLANGRITRIFDMLVAPYADVQLVRSSEEAYRVYTLEDELLGRICRDDHGTWTAGPLEGKYARNMTRMEALAHLVLCDRAARNKPKTVQVWSTESDYPAPVELTPHGNGHTASFAGEHIGSIYPGEFYHCEGFVVFDTDAICHLKDTRNEALDTLLVRHEELRLRAEAARRARWIQETVATIEEQGEVDGTSGEVVARELMDCIQRRTRNGYFPSV